MKKLCIIVVILLSSGAYSQEMMVHKTNGTVESFLISQIDSITFSTAVIPTEGLVAYYPFNGNANDESGHGFIGTVYGATLTTDRFGNPGCAYSFDGLTNYIEILNTSNLDFITGGFTLIGWCNYSASNFDNVIIGKHNWGQENGDYLLESFENKLCFFLQQTDTITFSARILTDELYNDGNWHFIAGVYNDTEQSLFVDGDLKKTKNAIYEGTNTANIIIGSATGGGFFNGQIDDIRIYNRPLTSSEIQQLYHEGGRVK